MEREAIFQLLRDERAAQNKKWDRVEGKWDYEESLKLTVLVEEVGEVVEACAAYAHGGERAYERELLRAELVQVGAVIIAWLEDVWGLPTEGVIARLRELRLTLREPFEGAMWTSAAMVQQGRLARAVFEKNKVDTIWTLRQLFQLTLGWLERLRAT